MRKQFVQTIEKILKNDANLVLLLGDISVFGFRNSFAEFPDRVYNIGILEQSTIGTAAGLAMQGLIPVVHTIAPFIVERSFEQLKDDFGYQKLGGNFVSIGASYDYAALGCTHHCPGDIGILKQIPTMEIVVPGTALEFDSLFNQSYANGKPTYFRLGEKNNKESYDVKFGKAHIVQTGGKATIITVGPMLDKIKEACKDLDVTILYYTTLTPFDQETLRQNICGSTLFICEPYYSGALTFDVVTSGIKPDIQIVHIGVPREFIYRYGTTEDIDKFLGLTAEDIRVKIKNNI